MEIKNYAVDGDFHCLMKHTFVYLFKAMRTTANLPFGLHDVSFQRGWRGKLLDVGVLFQGRSHGGKSESLRRRA